ncbi:S41 family peptidase [Candidatus Electronema sp. PJ]|uniref:S41 family peptidase n=1 Tax=Candidatus Electronema sp. PJ TaxID=3401572 RepID=UPI003AA95C3C
MKHPLLRLCVSVALSIALFSVPLAAEERSSNREAELYGNLETFATILDLVQKHYVKEISSSDIMLGAVNGMLGALDPHSSYLSPKDFKELQEDASGSFSGVGIEVTVKDGMLTVVSPIVGTPAFEKGIKAGDRIVKINGQAAKEMTLNDAIRELRGKIGDKITLTVSRDNLPHVQDIVLTRALIPQHSVLAAKLAPGLHHIQINNFQIDTARDCQEALNKAAKQEPIKGLILDLRNNPGGLLEQAVNVADLFIPEGLIVSTKGRGQEQQFLADPKTEKYTFPVVVLVNEGSASAAEIVAGALQDHQRATLLGTKTFGKGSVQTVVPLPGGAGLRLTTARYYTPSGKSIQETGISPDIVVPFEDSEEEMSSGMFSGQIREKDLLHHFENLEQQAKEKKAKQSQAQELEQQLAEDNQLRAALFILQHLPQ